MCFAGYKTIYRGVMVCLKIYIYYITPMHFIMPCKLVGFAVKAY